MSRSRIFEIKTEPELIPLLNLRIHGDGPNPTRVYIEHAPIERHNDHYLTGSYGPVPEGVLAGLGRLLHEQKPVSLPVYTGSAPGEILFYGPNQSGDANLLLVAEAAVRFSQFETKNLVGVIDADLPMPRCIMQVRNSRLNLFALRSEDEVNDNTPLMIPPTLNVSVDGSVCMGSMIRPKADQFKTVEQLGEAWWEMFFLSKGSHEHGAGIQVLSDKRSLKALYQQFIKDKAKVFPDELLLPVPKTCHYQKVGDLRKELIRLI